MSSRHRTAARRPVDPAAAFRRPDGTLDVELMRDELLTRQHHDVVRRAEQRAAEVRLRGLFAP